MTFRIRIRGATTGTIVLEYRCPVHGLTERSVPRGHAPDVIECDVPVATIEGMDLLVYCNRLCPWSPSRAPTVSIPIVSAGSKARDQDRPHQGYMSTRAIAEGQSVAEWKAERAEYWEERRKEDVMEQKR